MSKLKETAEAVSGKSQAEMDLVVNGGLVRASGTMKDAGISEGDMIMVQPKQQPQRQQQSTAGQQAPQMQVNADGSFMYPEQVIELLRSRPQGLTQLRQTNPDLCRAVENGDVSALQQLMRQVCPSKVHFMQSLWQNAHTWRKLLSIMNHFGVCESISTVCAWCTATHGKPTAGRPAGPRVSEAADGAHAAAGHRRIIRECHVRITCNDRLI